MLGRVHRGLLAGWDARQRQTETGAVESEQRVDLPRPVVEFSERGAALLGSGYWSEVRRCTLGLVRQRDGCVRLLGRGPALLRFGEPVLEATPAFVACRYPIRGGLLARRPEGELDFVQSPSELRSSIRGFFPALAAHDGEPDWTGALYTLVQSRIHVAISRRYFARLIAESRP
jgi:hypothetical protein